MDNCYAFDANGNQTTWTIDGQSYTLGYDADRGAQRSVSCGCRRQGHLVSVCGPSYSAAFTYNGDGQRVKQVINPSTGSGPCCETIYFVGNYFEQHGGQITTCYYAGSERIAQRIPRSLSRSLTVQARFPSASPKRDHACISVHPSATGLAWTSGRPVL